MTLQNNSDQTIVALCTPTGSGALGLIRLSGINALVIADHFCKLSSGKKISQQPTHSIAHGWVIDQQGTHIDQVLFLIMHGPKTFTGQNTVEITCHNNQFLIERIIDQALKSGARLAGRGEFSARAVHNGKIDLIQAEAIHDLIHAQTAAAAQASMAQLDGSLSSLIQNLEEKTLEILAFCEGSFEFLDEELEFGSEISEKLRVLLQNITNMLKDYPKQQLIKEGFKITLIGSVNAGKSSLFNALVKKNRAIVTPIAGTTRDAIETTIFHNGEFFTFIDTAGIRQTNDFIEQQGIDRSFLYASTADIIVLVVDQATTWNDQETKEYQSIIEKYQHKIICVLNKSDLPKNQSPKNINLEKIISVSALHPETIPLIFQAIQEKITILKGSGTTEYLLNQRHHDLLANFAKHLETIIPMLEKKKIDYELVSNHLREALQLLCEMTGHSISQKTFEKVFNTFCVGK